MVERRSADLHATRIAAVLALLGVVIVACAAGVYAVARAWDAPLAGSSGTRTIAVEPPQLQSAPQEDRTRYFADKEKRLGEYGWVDRERGIARIPIEQAMKLVAEGRR